MTPTDPQWQKEALDLIERFTEISQPTIFNVNWRDKERLKRAAAILTDLANGQWVRRENEMVAIDVANGLQKRIAQLEKERDELRSSLSRARLRTQNDT